MPIDVTNSAEVDWLKKPVLESRVLDHMTVSATWSFTDTGTLTFPAEPRRGDMRVLPVDMQMFGDSAGVDLAQRRLRRLVAGRQDVTDADAPRGQGGRDRVEGARRCR